MKRREILDEQWLHKLGYRLDGETAIRRPAAARRPPQRRAPRAPEVTWEGRTLTIRHLRLISEANRWEHWHTRWQRGKAQRLAVYWALRETGWPRPRLPCTFVLAAALPALMDDDNYRVAWKHGRDACADFLAGAYGQGQDRQPGLTWVYAQTQGTVIGITITLHEGRAVL